MEAKEVTPPELKNVFPPAAILKRWHAGEDVDWPPLEEWDEGDDLPGGMPQLRFEVGQKVLCRIGRDTWGPGEIVQLWYREAHWVRVLIVVEFCVLSRISFKRGPDGLSEAGDEEPACLRTLFIASFLRTMIAMRHHLFTHSHTHSNIHTACAVLGTL